MTTKMTPGPWRYVLRKNQTGITRAFVDFGNGFVEMTDRPGDAQAIASLPDLLAENERLRAALLATITPLIRLGDFIGNEDVPGVVGLGPFDRCAILLQVYNALAKAAA